MKSSFLRSLGRLLARHFNRPSQRGVRGATNPPEILKAALRKGDVLLVEGNNRFSVAIKYLTQSTWSHAALYIGDAVDSFELGESARVIVEADVMEGVRLSPLSIFYEKHTRICRPVGLTPQKINDLVRYSVARIGNQYDLKNVFDLARYFIQRPPVPSHWRRHLLSIGSGDPTRAICSSLIAQAFHSVSYPILPEFIACEWDPSGKTRLRREYARIRHHSLFAPSDFDLSPYFKVVKPTIEFGFNPTEMIWEDPNAVIEDSRG